MTSSRSVSQSNRSQLQVEELEDRQLLSTMQPTALEQLMLERLNDARADPAAYGQSIGLDLSYVASSQPLAFDPRLIEAARKHSQSMSDNRFFSHSSLGGQNLGHRLSAEGYPWTSYAESIAAGFATPEAALRALIVDHGVPSLGHRRHLLAIDAVFKNLNQVGIGIVQNGRGPYVNYFTIDTASSTDTRPFLTGAVFNDLNNNGKYDIGEAVGNLTMTVHGVGSITTYDSGGYSFQVSPGTYTVSFSGEGLNGTITKTVTIGQENVRLNVLTNNESPQNPGQNPQNPGQNPQNPGQEQPPQQPPVAPPPQPQPPPGPSAERVWVMEVAQRLLQRPLSNSEASHWENFLRQGGTQNAVITAFVNSTEYQILKLTRWVKQTGVDVLGRQLNAVETNHWVNFLRSGGAKEIVVWNLFSWGGIHGRSHIDFMRHLSRSVLQRELYAVEVSAWTNYLNLGGSRWVAVQMFMGSGEYKQKQLMREVQHLAASILGQPLSLAEQYSWAGHLQSGGSETTLIATLLNRRGIRF